MTVKIKEKKCLVAVRVTPELYRWVKNKAEDEGVSMGALVRKALIKERKGKGSAA